MSTNLTYANLDRIGHCLLGEEDPDVLGGLIGLVSEVAALKAEVKALKAEIALLKKSPVG